MWSLGLLSGRDSSSLGHDAQAQVLLDAEQAEAGPLHRTERGPQQRPGVRAVYDLRFGRGVVLAIDPDGAAARRPYVLRPVRLVAEGQRDHGHIAADPGAGR